MHSTLYYSRRLIYKSCMLVRRYTYIISYAVHSHFLLANIICLIYRYIYVYHTNIYIPSITIHTMHTYVYYIIPSTLHTYVYIFYLPPARMCMFPQTPSYSTRTTIQHQHREKQHHIQVHSIKKG